MSNFSKMNDHLMAQLDRLANATHSEVIEYETKKAKAIVDVVKVQVEMANTMIRATEVAYDAGLTGGAKQLLGIESK